jgi:lysophospholipase L1-like esterase
MKKYLKQLNDLWIIAGITLLLLLMIEMAFSLYYSNRSSTDTRTQADCYPNEAWVKDLYDEFSASSMEIWHSYVYWRRKPFSGSYIHIGDDGLRTSTFPVPDSISGTPAIRIFFMGGSTLWGTGVRDDYTIPSLTGKLLSQQGIHAEVFNFGESGYVSTQGLIALMVELKKENIPDLVVFYDGINDVFSAFQQKKAGIPQNEFNRQNEFNAFRGKKRVVRSILHAVPTFSTVRFITEKMNSKKRFISTLSAAGSDSLSSAVAQHYRNNVRMIRALGMEYGFKTHFYWQPAIFHKKYLTGYEMKQAEENSYLRDFYEQAYRKTTIIVTEPDGIDFKDISNIFLGLKEPVFIDWCHVGESGNFIIAEKMAGDLIPACHQILKEKTR